MLWVEMTRNGIQKLEYYETRRPRRSDTLSTPSGLTVAHDGTHDFPVTSSRFPVCAVMRHALLPMHAFHFLQLTLTRQQFLSLFVNLSLHLQLNVMQFLLFPMKLLFLQADRLGGEIFRVYGGVPVIITRQPSSSLLLGLREQEASCGTYAAAPPSTLLLNFSVL